MALTTLMGTITSALRMCMHESTFILIPVHNRREVTVNCLRCLHSDVSIQTWPGLRIVVIDDGSTDGTAAAIQREFPEVTILRGDGHLWWTGAIHMGMEYAYDQGGEYFLWLNDDCIPAPGSLWTLFQLSKQRGCILGAACYLGETGQLQPTGAYGRTRVAPLPGTLQPVDEMSGHCVAIPRCVVNAIGLPDKQHFPHYHGDTSYVLQATRAGFQAYLFGNAKIVHPEHIKSGLKDFTDFESVSLKHSFKRLFLTQKSLYFVPTQFHYNAKKYGLVLGSGLFVLKSGWWLIRWSCLSLVGV